MFFPVIFIFLGNFHPFIFQPFHILLSFLIFKRCSLPSVLFYNIILLLHELMIDLSFKEKFTKLEIFQTSFLYEHMFNLLTCFHGSQILLIFSVFFFLSMCQFENFYCSIFKFTCIFFWSILSDGNSIH